ncbi:MAG TPA: acyl-CoA dehydrogenase family protein [Acidimicrobiales bacterium]|nr:acyl-CoA dehydrogenase family protein [Acidimicrobiales bacterium]
MTTVSVSSDERLVRDQAERLVSEHDPKDAQAFWGAQFDLGLAWVHFPEGYGGLGVSPGYQNIVNEALAKVNAPSNYMRNPIGLGMGAPTVVSHGSEDQKRRYLRPLFTCEEIWCQLFSEPGAGSDVASLSTRAVRDGDEWVVNGQKVWTTLAHRARWGMLVARTDPEAAKHRGLTYFVVDMHGPGVEVRPLRQMTGEAEFNEVYFTDARIPDSERLGDVGAGWNVAITTLMNERVSIGGSVAPRGSGFIGEAVRLWKEKGHTDPALRDRLMQAWIAAEVTRLTNIRASQARKSGTPGPEGSTGKLASAELNKRITELCIDLMGADGMLYSSYEMLRPEEAGLMGRDVAKSFLRMRANSIEGGTSEVMRNILGERVLGLPGDVRVDKDRPWSEVPRS